MRIGTPVKSPHADRDARPGIDAMTPAELKAAYEVAARPYLEAPGPASSGVLGLRSWRYVFEINSACNLKCALCHAGNRTGYDYTPGIMDRDLMERCLDKIKTENPSAVICCYVNSEPFLHPRLAECVRSIKSRGFRCELSSNFNTVKDLETVLKAGPDLFTVSVSGFTQSTYERAHRGGNIELVKENLIQLGEIIAKKKYPVHVGVSYHMYRYNLHEVDLVKQFTEKLGFQFLLSWARAISIENTLQAIRELERQKGITPPPYASGPNGQDLNTLLPAANPEFMAALDNLRFHPAKAAEFYEKWPIAPVCLIADVFTEIRWDGRVQLCAWTDDMRLTIGNFMEMNHYQRTEARLNHPLCQECLRRRLNLYFHIVDPQRWDSIP